MRGSHGIEMDELRYASQPQKRGKKHGIYPPPLIGDANNPEIVARVKAHRARIAKLSPEEQERYYRDSRAFMTGFLTGFLKGFASATSSGSAEDP